MEPLIFIMNSFQSHIVALNYNDRSIIVYHSLLNYPQLIEFESALDKQDFLISLNNGPIKSGFKKLDYLLSLSDAKARQIQHEKQNKYLQNIPAKINYLSLIIAECCNLNCSFCITSNNIKSAKSNSQMMMSFEIAQKAIDWYLELPSNRNEHHINFSGGEPLLNKSLISEVVSYIKLKMNGLPVRFTINTNATLIDEVTAKYFASNNFEIATSLDGIPIVNDIVRLTKSGSPSSKKILEGWQKLKDAGCEITGFMATFNSDNLGYLDTSIVDFAVDMGFSWIRISYDVVHLMEYPIEMVIEQIMSVFLYGQKKGITIEGFWSSATHNLLSITRSNNNFPFFCGAVSGETISIHPEGRISTCGFSSESLGNILDSNPYSHIEHMKFVENYFPGNRASCKGCDIEGSCAGGCHITRENALLSMTDKAINYNCLVNKEITNRLLKNHFDYNHSDSS